MNVEDSSLYIIKLMRNPDSYDIDSYGYDIYLPNIARYYISELGTTSEEHKKMKEYMPSFYAAAWELCRRGIIRPGIRQFMEQETPEGSAGNGYSITPFGSNWLSEGDLDSFVPTEPGRFSEMISSFKSKYGPGFHERSQEAIKCYGAHAYLSCCVMCGAAIESIILSAAISRYGEEEILSLYNGSNGRSRLENKLIAKSNEYIQREYKGYTSLLKYWRDTSSHGKKTNITENEAYTSLALLLRFAQFISDNWDELLK